MAEDKNLVRVIHYQFSGDALFLNLGTLDLGEYKVDESIQEYVKLCRESLRETYAEAEVEVFPEATSTNDTEVYVESLIGFEQIPDFEEIESIKEICERVFSQQEWVVLKNFVALMETSRRTKIPLSVIRWLCANNFIDAESKSTGRWRVLDEEVSRISTLVLFMYDQTQLSDAPTEYQVIACYAEDLQDLHLEIIPEHAPVLVVSKNGFEQELLTQNASHFLFQRNAQLIEVTVEHYIDVVGWSSSQWSYTTYVESLRSQARKHGILCEKYEVERSGKQEPDGITFSFSKNSTEGSLGQTTKMIVEVIADLCRNTILSLNGGPEWDHAFEKKGGELRFHQEFLEPLLQEMYYHAVYTHGPRGEHGRDFVFVEMSKFSDPIYYGLQAKAGNVSGGATSRDIDELVRQIRRAFLMPVAISPDKPEVYISTMIVAISGKFIGDAIDVIRKEIPKRLKGSVYFWDQEKLISLRNQFFKK